MVEMKLVYEGGLHTNAQHGPSGTRVETDAPVDNQGKGEAFSPTDLLATSLASCMLTTMAIVGDREGWNLEGARALAPHGAVVEGELGRERAAGRAPVR